MKGQAGDGASPREFGIEIEDGGVGQLLEALSAAPLSESLKELLWTELLDAPGLNSGPDGVTCCGDIAALGTGDFSSRVELGRAGKALVFAFRALAGSALDEIGDVCGHEEESPAFEITSEMVEAGVTALEAWEESFYPPSVV